MNENDNTYKDTAQELAAARERIAELEAQNARLQAEGCDCEEHDALLRLIVEHSSNLYYSHTADHQLTFLSPQVMDFMDCTPEEAKTRWTEFATDNPVNKKGFALTQKAVESGEKQPPYELELKGCKGRVVNVLVNESPIVENGRTTAIVGALTDITELKQAQKKLSRQHEYQQHLFDLIPLGLTLWNKEGTLLRTNKGFTDLTGYTADEIHDLEDWFILAYPDPAYRNKVLEDWESSSNLPDAVREFTVTCKGGVEKVVEFRGVFLPDGNALVTMADMTDRKQAEDALKESEARFRMITDLSKQAVFLSRNGVCIDANRAAIDMFGYSYEEFLHVHGSMFIAEKDREQIHLQMQQEKSEPYNVHGLHKDGTEFPVEIYARALEFGGEYLRVTFVTDLTERRRAEKALRQSEERHRIIFENSPLGMIFFDSTGTIVNCNDRFVELMGSSREKLIGFNSIQQGTNPKMVEAVRRAVNGEDSVFEDVYTSVTGNKTFRLRVNFSPVNPGVVPTEVIATLEDVTGIREAEEALAAGEERLSLVLDAVRDGHWDWDVATGKTYFSPRYFTMLGYEPDEFPATFESWRELLHPEDVDKTLAVIENHLEKGLPFGIEFRAKTKNGDWRWILGRGKVVDFDETGRATRMVGTHTDITELVQARQELEKAKEAAEAANHAKSRFLANMSHELRTPLNGVMGMLQLLKRTPMHERQHEYADAALRSGKNLTQLLSDILDLSRIEVGKLEIFDEPFSFKDLMEGLRDSFLIAAREKGLEFILKVDENIPDRLIGDAVRVRQILLNLVGNAVKFTTKGKVEVEARLQNNDQGPDCKVLFIIADTGVGIPADKQNQIFEPFTQLDGSYSRRYQGAGLGLQIVKRLAELLDARISLESEPGAGTTFFFSIGFSLLAEEAPAPSDADRLPEHAPQDHNRILMAEDDATNAKAVKFLLEQQGYRVTHVYDGLECLDALRNEKFDAVLMDIQMPHMSGVEAARRIRNSPDYAHIKHIPVIALTAYAMSGDREKFLNVGMDDYIAKPVDVDDLVVLLNRLILKDTSKSGGRS